jgi:hypothetical protein
MTDKPLTGLADASANEMAKPPNPNSPPENRRGCFTSESMLPIGDDHGSRYSALAAQGSLTVLGFGFMPTMLPPPPTRAKA